MLINYLLGDEEMTGAQNSYLHTLADEAGEKLSDDLTKAEAAKILMSYKKRLGESSRIYHTGIL